MTAIPLVMVGLKPGFWPSLELQTIYIMYLWSSLTRLGGLNDRRRRVFIGFSAVVSPQCPVLGRRVCLHL